MGFLWVRVASWSAFSLGVAISCIARAQPQDDAALADVHVDKPPVAAQPGSSRPSKRQHVSNAPREPEAKPEPTFTTEEMRQRYHDLELRVVPPPTVTVGLLVIYPFQTFGLGLGVDAYAVPRLRFTVIASPGASQYVNKEWRFSFYADASVGVVLVRAHSQTFGTVPLIGPRPHLPRRSTFERLMFGEEPLPTSRALVPSSHSLELAAGAFTGLYSLYRCTNHCNDDPHLIEHTNEDASRQTTFLYAGLRYVYYRSASSERGGFSSIGAFEAGVDALTNPFTSHDKGIFNSHDNHPTYNAAGVRLTMRIPAITCSTTGRCFGLDLMGGYLPSPANAMFSVNALLR